MKLALLALLVACGSSPPPPPPPPPGPADRIDPWPPPPTMALVPQLKRYRDDCEQKNDPYPCKTGFMEACIASDRKLARLFWSHLQQEARTHFVEVCVRNGITEEELSSSSDRAPMPMP